MYMYIVQNDPTGSDALKSYMHMHYKIYGATIQQLMILSVRSSDVP